MAEYLYPGVYIEEIERGPRPIEGVPTSTAAIVGETERGPTMPLLVTSYKDYQRWFGDVFHDSKYVPYAVNGFFENGGSRAYISRVVGNGATSAAAEFGDFSVRAAGPGGWGNRVWVIIGPSTTKKAGNVPVGFRIQVAYWSAGDAYDFLADPRNPQVPTLREDFDDLVADEASPDFYAKRVPFLVRGTDVVEGPTRSALFILVRNADAEPNARPDDGTTALSNGQDDDDALEADDFVGLPSAERPVQGLSALELDPYRDVALVHAPGIGMSQNAVAKAITSHCENMRFRFAVFDSARGTEPADPRLNIATTQYGALYYPWLFISDPKTGARKIVPPGGYVLGIYARTDTERGVFKAPANEVVRGALALETDINDKRQGTLNPIGINAIRSFPGRGIRVWGARTLSDNSLWKYVSVRRLFIFLERSIFEGTQFVVFEPNDERLWARVTDTLRLFLRTQWRLGALMGRTEGEAFFITCDRTTMTQDDVLNGRLVCEVGIAPVRPAEFVIFRVFQNTAESQR